MQTLAKIIVFMNTTRKKVFRKFGLCYHIWSINIRSQFILLQREPYNFSYIYCNTQKITLKIKNETESTK